MKINPQSNYIVTQLAISSITIVNVSLSSLESMLTHNFTSSKNAFMYIHNYN